MKPQMNAEDIRQDNRIYRMRGRIQNPEEI